MSVGTIVILSAIIGALLDLITAFVVVGAAYVLFQVTYGISWLILRFKTHNKVRRANRHRKRGRIA